MMQAAPDIMLGWERIVAIDGETKDFYVRPLVRAAAAAFESVRADKFG